MHNFKPTQQTAESLESRINDILHRDLPKEPKEAVRDLISFLDLTSLEGKDTRGRILQLCQKAQSYSYNNNPLGVAAVCTYPVFSAEVKSALLGSGIATAAVAGGFPSGQTSIDIKAAEVAWAVSQGADEVDIVISRGKLIEGNEKEVFDEILKLREAASGAHLKVILETGELITPQLIHAASTLAINAGADFIKTSTGKIQPAATLPAFLLMIDAINEYRQSGGRNIGIKAAGGISDVDVALDYYKLVYYELGEEYIHPSLFRIGASRLADKLGALL